jgi:hypothetical protein
MKGVEVDSTPSLRHLEKILSEKVESLGQDKVAVWPLPPCWLVLKFGFLF